MATWPNFLSMKKLKPSNTFSWISILFLFSACNQGPFPDPDPVNPKDSTSFFNVLWQVPLTRDTNQIVSGEKIIENGDVINVKGFSTPDNILTKIDGDSGETMWSWKDNRITDGSETALTDGLIFKDGKILLGSSKYSFFIDSDSGENIFVDDPGISTRSYLDFNSIVEDYVFRTIDPLDGPNSQYSELVYYDLNILETAKLFYHQPNENDFAPYLQSVAGYRNQNQDLILVFQNRQYRFSPARGKVDLISYNMTQDTLVWKQEDLTVARSSNVIPPVIFREKIYFAGSKNIYCLDLHTGEKLWHTNPSPTNSGYFTSHYKIIDNKLIVNDDEWNLMALDPISGRTIWHIPDMGNTNTLEHYCDILFVSNDNLFAIDVRKGEVIAKFDSPNKLIKPDATFYAEGIGVDAKNKRIFVSDSYFLMCLEINP